MASLSEDKNFVDMCPVCKQGVSKTTMTYKNGRVFHLQCFEAQGSSFPKINEEIAQISARTRIELVQMKNLKIRSDADDISRQESETKAGKKKRKKDVRRKIIKIKKKTKSKTKHAKKVKTIKKKRR